MRVVHRRGHGLHWQPRHPPMQLMDKKRQLRHAYDQARQIERDAWQRVGDTEGSIEGAADAWNAWLAAADEVMRLGLQLHSRPGSLTQDD